MRDCPSRYPARNSRLPQAYRRAKVGPSKLRMSSSFPLLKMDFAPIISSVPLENRVDPFGNLFRTPARGTMMGNRGGALHNSEREIVRNYKSRRWIACVLEFRGRRRIVMSERRYTELFFLDEAVALAAGHRPCAECRHAAYQSFLTAWAQALARPAKPAAD